MELNTINKTGTWSETADRINSNFSKISIEVEEIKQNGGGGSGGGGGDVTNADHANSAYTLDKDTPVQNWFLSALNDDDAQGIINYLKGLKIAGNLINRIVKQGDKDVTYTDEDVMSVLRVMTEIENSAEKLKEIFLRKDVADSTKFLLSMFAGAVFGKNGFASGLTGFGAKIFDTGHGEFESMFIRRFLEVPELRYNRVMVTLGDKWRAPGAGIIETVDTGTKTCTLKLEDGEIGAVAVGDICMGIYHNITGNATEDYDDGKGNRRFAGFCTVYFTVTEVTGERNETFKYQLRPTSSSWSSSFDPFEMMTFVAYGSFTNTERQTSVYETRTYTRMLWKQNTWEISAANVALQYGDLSNLNIFGLNMDGYSMYLNNIYMTGIIKQIKPDGTPVQTLNFREEGYIPGVHYDYYDSLSYNGSMWACINEDGSSSVPGSNGDWLEIASKGDTGTPGAPGKDGVSVTNSGPWYSGLVVPKMSIVTMGGSSFLSKVATTNPPLWCWTDNAGNRFTFSDGGYCLTGEINTDEYELLVQSGKDGRDAKDHEFIFTNTTTNTRPSTPETSQTDDYVPSGWNDDPVGVSASIPYEWVSKRTKKDGIWGAFSTPEPWANHSFNAISADLEKLENLKLPDRKNNSRHILDAFLFCCYCGLRFSDFKQLTCKNLVTVDGKEWLVMNSIKTGVKLNIPLYLLFNGKALGIMRKYDSIEQLAALGCNSDTNRTLQKLGRMAHIGKKFTYHTSRHTCATLLVHQGVPITTVQKLLGHTSVKTTEIYSEVFDETIIKDLTRANQKYYNRRNVKQNQIKSQKYPEKYLRQ